jgi:hypothetical protein
VNGADVDRILEFQLGVAWAGETIDRSSSGIEARLDWWRTQMTDEDAGVDLLRRLTPRTWEWAVLECARAAAIRVDEAARRNAEDPDNLLSLYRLGFENDEWLGERLAELKRGEAAPREHFPRLQELINSWSRAQFETWVAPAGAQAFTTTATGRRVRAELPGDLAETASRLAAALVPLAPTYPLPYFRLGR